MIDSVKHDLGYYNHFTVYMTIMCQIIFFKDIDMFEDKGYLALYACLALQESTYNDLNSTVTSLFRFKKFINIHNKYIIVQRWSLKC